MLVSMLMIMSSVTMAAAAYSSGGMLLPGAVAAVTYTAATVNNAFETELHPFFRTFGSHMASLITMAMIFFSIRNAPIGSEQVFFIIASLSFILEGFISLSSLYLGNNFGTAARTIQELEMDTKNDIVETAA